MFRMLESCSRNLAGTDRWRPMPDALADLVRSLRLELLLQLVLAAVLGGVIGLERELSGKPAGLRTNILICTGATLFTVLSFHLAGSRGDPARVAAQILPGVGFIGAGTILHMRGAVTGLTSAATIWVVAAIGMALGSGEYVEGVGTTLLVMVVLLGLGRFERLLARKAIKSRLVVHAAPQANLAEELESIIQAAGLEIERSQVRREHVDAVVELELRGPRRCHEQALVAIVHHAGVRSVSTGE
jgi:putative Mg2+ transporter-C (MgtC) family protein